MAEIRGLGADLVAISPQRPEFLRQMRKKHDIEFEILRDKGNELADLFGLRYTLPGYLQELYLEFGIDLPRVNGDDSWSLPMPARYVVSGEGRIISADFDADYRFRPEPSDTIEHLKQLKDGIGHR